VVIAAAKADEVRLRELCNELLGPARPGGASGGSAADVDSTEQWSPEVCHPLTLRLDLDGTRALV